VPNDDDDDDDDIKTRTSISRPIKDRKTEMFVRCVQKPTSCFSENITRFNPLTPELNPSAQRCLKIFFIGDLAS
jgi:hypothetical protein